MAECARRGCCPPGGVRILYIRRVWTGSSSLDAAPVTGSLVFSVPVYCLDVYCAAGFFRGCYLAALIVAGLLVVDYLAGELEWT